MGWADLGPKGLGRAASLGLRQTSPRHKGWARKDKKQGGNYLPAPILLFRSACKRNLYRK